MNQFDPSDTNMEDEILSWIETALDGESAIILVSEDDQGINGFARTQQKERTSDTTSETINYAKLSDLYIAPHARRRGIACKLIHASIDWAKDQQLTEMILNVYEKNSSAHTLYKSFGFQDDCAISLGRIRMHYSL